jgi:predicted amidohydrolase
MIHLPTEEGTMRELTLAAAQRPPLPIGTPVAVLAADVAQTLASHPGVDLLVYPELHLFDAIGDDEVERARSLRDSAVPLDGPMVHELGALARDAGVWLIPGSICELGPSGELFNTALVFDPSGHLVASYRKVFPWRPFEPYDPGDRFVVVDLPGTGRIGISICYDAWFPEVTRHLAWMGAELVVNVVKTTTPDREQEVVLAHANSIVNQTFTLSVNCAGPTGRGRSVLVDPEGATLAELDDARTDTLIARIDLDQVAGVRRVGTAGTNRMWEQLRADDRPIALPLYAGELTPSRWRIAAPPSSESPS